MITNLITLAELKEINAELFLQNTSKVTKLSDGGVANAFLFGNAKLAQILLKEIALNETRIIIDSTTGSDLDEVAALYGVEPRFQEAGSSTYVRLVGDGGTLYESGIHEFTGKDGVTFTLDSDITINDNGFGYAKVSSVETGAYTNVAPLSVNRINTAPVGHRYVVNEFAAIGGRNVEEDDVFRDRIKESRNLGATNTLAKITQIFSKINSRVLRVFHYGFNVQGKVILGVLAENGVDFTAQEFDDILVRMREFLGLVELSPFGYNSYGIELRNIEWQEIDISVRVDLFDNFNNDDVRVEIQNQISSYLDYRYWKANDAFEWDNVLQLIKETSGVKYVYDQYFHPRYDIKILNSRLPRIRGFLLLDAQGNITSDNNNILNPVFYPMDKDFSFQSTMLNSI